MHQHKEKPPQSLTVIIGPYITPRQVFLLIMFFRQLGMWTFLAGFVFCFGRIMEPQWTYKTLSKLEFIKHSWLEWMFLHPLQVFLWSLGSLIVFNLMEHVSDWIVFFFFRKRRKVIFTYDAVKIRRFFSFKSYKREEGISFELVKHHKPDKTDLSERVKIYRECLEDTGIVLMRCGARRPVRLAVIYDWIPFDMGHNAQQSVDILQRVLKTKIEHDIKGNPLGQRVSRKL